MSKKLMFIEVRGKEKSWCFDFYGDPQYLAEWQADGLKIHAAENTIPADLPSGLIKPWLFLQDLFNFKNPFRK